MKTIQNIFISLMIGSLFCGCTKLVTVDAPTTVLPGADVFDNDATATAAMLNVYIGMENSDTYTIPLLTGLLGDELESYEPSSTNMLFYNNALPATNETVQLILDRGYNFIYNANAVLEGVAQSKGMSAKAKQQLRGEASFIRAFWHFYLVNFFGSIPVVSSTDYRINAAVAQASVDSVYAFILNDLHTASTLLTKEYFDASNSPTAEKVRPNLQAVYALMARTYLYQKNYSKAGEFSSLVINSSLYQLTDINDVFLKNSREAIWQLMPVNKSYSSCEGNNFIPSSAPPTGLTASFMQGFEAGDLREANWTQKFTGDGIDYYYPFKYKVKSIAAGTDYPEYSMVLRLSEQYLIRAEAEAYQNNLSAALADVNIIRGRAALPNLPTGADQSTILSTIEQERRSELFCEWAHRWFDLKRTGRADAVLGPIKPSWKSQDVLLPIPQKELGSNPNLHQNAGY